MTHPPARHYLATVTFVFESGEIEPVIGDPRVSFAEMLQRDLYDDAGMSGAFQVETCEPLPGTWDGIVPCQTKKEKEE